MASGKNKDLVLGPGVDGFIDYTIEDFTKNEEKYVFIFDNVANSPMSRWKAALKPNGTYVNAGPLPCLLPDLC